MARRLTGASLLLALSAACANAQADNSGRQKLIEDLDALANTQLEARAQSIAKIQTPAAADQRKTLVRRKILDLMGGLPANDAPLAVKQFGTLLGEGFHVEKLAYESLPGFWVTANLYVPESGTGPYPAVLLTPGHEATGKQSQYSFGGNFARSGIMALAIDPLGQGERLQYFDPAKKASAIGGSTGEHGEANIPAMLIGEDVARYFFGHDCQSESLKARSAIGYLPGEMGGYSDLTGYELLTFLERIGAGTVSREYRNNLTERFELSDRDLSRKLREYSMGMKRKLGLVQAFQADPLLLILDEPTEGLDPLMQESFYDLLADARNRGRTVFMSSHVLPEVERVCDRIAMLRKGEVVLISSVQDARKLASRRVRVEFQQDVAAPSSLPQGYDMIDAKPRTWILRVTGPLGSLPSFLADFPVADLAVEEARLEDVLVKYYRDGPK